MLDQAQRPATPATTAGDEPGSWEAFRARKYFSEVDGLRMLAITAVVWNHAGPRSGDFGWGLGVKLFFVISGFLITTLLLRERDRAGTISLSGFYVRRSLRIFPLYFLVLGVYAVLVLLTERDTPAGVEFFRNLPAYLTFTANWFVAFEVGTRVIFYFAWSLSAQEQFYFVWPAAVRLCRRRWAPVLLMAGALVASYGMQWAIQAGLIGDSVLLVRAVARFPMAIGFGFLSAYLLHDRRGFAWARPLVAQRFSPLLGLALMLAQVVWPTTSDLVPILGAVVLTTSCAARPDHVLAPLLKRALVRHIGVVSLGIYLMHMLALHAARRIVPGGSRLPVFALGFTLSILAASASYRWLEQPVMGLKRFLVPATAARGKPETRLAG